MENANNYFVFKESRFTTRIGYVDIKDHMADDFFESCNFPIVFYKKEAQRPGSDYCIVFCCVPTKRMDEFREIMQDMTLKMLLTGHTDYMEFCNNLGFLRSAATPKTKEDILREKIASLESMLEKEHAEVHNSMYGISKKEMKLQRALDRANKELNELLEEKEVERE